jgi:hypothetical protein
MGRQANGICVLGKFCPKRSLSTDSRRFIAIWKWDPDEPGRQSQCKFRNAKSADNQMIASSFLCTQSFILVLHNEMALAKPTYSGYFIGEWFTNKGNVRDANQPEHVLVSNHISLAFR